jgi:hypothetical protein
MFSFWIQMLPNSDELVKSGPMEDGTLMKIDTFERLEAKEGRDVGTVLTMEGYRAVMR